MDSTGQPKSETMIRLRQLGLDHLKRTTELQQIIYEKTVKRDFGPMHIDSTKGDIDNQDYEKFRPMRRYLTEEDIDKPDYEVEGPVKFGNCTECVKAVPVFTSSQIAVGDHITFPGMLYNHHAIVTEKVGDNQIKIIEATNKAAGAVFGLTFWKNAFIEETVKTLDYAKDRMNIVVYKNRVFTKAKVARRARVYCDGERDYREFLRCNPFRNNCEHFATYCVTGISFSIQAVTLPTVSELFLGSAFLGISDERMLNSKLFENNLICSRCDEINRRLLSVGVKPILSADGVQAGDVIRYTYYNFQHEAVVLEINGTEKTSVNVSIAHYAFCGFLSNITIIKEKLTIQFDGSFDVLQYRPPQYDVFSSETVVQRAKSRINEQHFVFFSNDSSHFVRWCKLSQKP